MSLTDQEVALFHLLFDDGFREGFAKHGVKFLQKFSLDDTELNDFIAVRPAALELDAKLRKGMLLSQMCRHFPMSFSLISSFSHALQGLVMLIDTDIAGADPDRRPSVFGERLKQLLIGTGFETEAEHNLLLSVVDTELGMANSACALRQSLRRNQSAVYQTAKWNNDSDWENKPVALADFVSATLIPCSLAHMQEQLCPVSNTELWQFLKHTALDEDTRQTMAFAPEPRLLVCRAECAIPEHCDPAIDYRTLELSAGFAQLLQHAQGQFSVQEILANLESAGATAALLDSVREGYKQLLINQMLVQE